MESNNKDYKISIKSKRIRALIIVFLIIGVFHIVSIAILFIKFKWSFAQVFHHQLPKILLTIIMFGIFLVMAILMDKREGRLKQ